MAERLLHVSIGSPVDGSQNVSQKTNRDISLIVKTLKKEKIIENEDDVSVVAIFDSKLHAGTVGRKVELVEVIRDEDGLVIDTKEDKFTVDFKLWLKKRKK